MVILETIVGGKKKTGKAGPSGSFSFLCHLTYAIFQQFLLVTVSTLLDGDFVLEAVLIWSIASLLQLFLLSTPASRREQLIAYAAILIT